VVGSAHGFQWLPLGWLLLRRFIRRLFDIVK
jgi:hypothetical protein